MADSLRERDAEPVMPIEEMVAVRGLERGDYPGYASLLWEGDRAHHEAMPERIRPPEQAQLSENEFFAFLDDPDVLMVGVEVGATLAGMARASYRATVAGRLHLPRRFVLVEEIVVGAPFQRRGIGRMLMARVQDWAGSRKAQAVELKVYDFNEPARALYDRLGFRPLLHMMAFPLD